MLETINLLQTTCGKGCKHFTKSGTDERGFQRYVTVVTPGRAVRSFKMTDPWPFNQNTRVRSRGRSGARLCLEPYPPRHFMRSRSHIRSWDIFYGTEIIADQNFAGFAFIPSLWNGSQSPALCPRPESEPPGHLSHAGAPVAADTSPD